MAPTLAAVTAVALLAGTTTPAQAASRPQPHHNKASHHTTRVPARIVPHIVTETIMLNAAARSGVSGMASFVYNARTRSTTVTAYLTHLPPRSQHPVSIHRGSCGASGALLYRFAIVRASRKGVGTTSTTFPGMFDSRRMNVAVYQGLGQRSHARTTIIACGTLTTMLG